MRKQKLTPWFPGNVKPARPGVYQQYSGTGKELGYQFWDGSHWHLWFETADQAAANREVASFALQEDPWRGLTSPGEKA